MQLSELICALALLLVGTLAQSNVIVEETSPALTYDPPFQYWGKIGVANGQPAISYYHGGGYVSTSSLGASVSLKFNGSYVAFYSDGYPAHGMMEVDLDSRKTNVSQYSPDVEGQKMFFQAYVDPDVPNHVLKLTCVDTKTMGVDYFVYTAATPKPVGSAAPAIPSASKSHATQTQSELTRPAVDTTPPASISTPADSETGGTPDPSPFFTNLDLSTETNMDLTTETEGSTSTSTPPNIIISSHSSSKTNIIVVVVSVFSGLLTLLCAPLYFILRRLRRRRRLRDLQETPTAFLTGLRDLQERPTASVAEVASDGSRLAADGSRASMSSTTGNQRPAKLDQLGMTDSLVIGSHAQPGPSRDYRSRLSQEYVTSDDVQPPPYV